MAINSGNDWTASMFVFLSSKGVRIADEWLEYRTGEGMGSPDAIPGFRKFVTQKYPVFVAAWKLTK
jgi:hypothetical protein